MSLTPRPGPFSSEDASAVGQGRKEKPLQIHAVRRLVHL
jgi:hypothetical protein